MPTTLIQRIAEYLEREYVPEHEAERTFSDVTFGSGAAASAQRLSAPSVAGEVPAAGMAARGWADAATAAGPAETSAPKRHFSPLRRRSKSDRKRDGSAGSAKTPFAAEPEEACELTDGTAALDVNAAWEYDEAEGAAPASLHDVLKNLDAPFSTTLLHIIDERGYTDAEVYNRAGISRQHFSKMRSDPEYRPTKKTVMALAVALKLNLSDAEDLMERAGFAFSRSSKGDLIVRFFIENGIYDIMQINDALYQFDQPLL